jgi:hypothetical protein
MSLPPLRGILEEVSRSAPAADEAGQRPLVMLNSWAGGVSVAHFDNGTRRPPFA